MSLKLVYSILSLILVISMPIIYYVYLRKILKIKPGFWNVLVGMILTFLCKDVLLNVVMVGIAYIPTIANAFSDTLLLGFVNIFLTIILLTLGYLIVRKIYYHGEIKVEQACGIALGATLAETLLSFLSAAMSNVIYIYQTFNGSLYDNLLLSVSAEQATKVIETYNNLPSSYFIYIGIIAVATLCSNYLISMIIARMQNRILIFIGILSLVTIIFYYTNPLVFNFANLSLAVFSVILFSFADLNCRFIINKTKSS